MYLSDVLNCSLTPLHSVDSTKLGTGQLSLAIYLLPAITDSISFDKDDWLR